MLLFGILFSIFEPLTRVGSIFSSRYFWHGAVFATLFNIAVFYAVIHFPDWMWMYFTKNSHQDVLELIYIFVFLYYLPYALGFYLGLDLRRKSKLAWALGLILCALTEAWLILHLFDRYSVVGTHEEFLSGTAISLFSPQNPLAPVTNGSLIAMVVYFFFVLFLYRRSRKSLSL